MYIYNNDNGIIFGFLDDQGREFDKYGDLAPWWNNVTIEKFLKRTECLVDQYNSYSINNQSLNGKQTLGTCIT